MSSIDEESKICIWWHTCYPLSIIQILSVLVHVLVASYKLVLIKKECIWGWVFILTMQILVQNYLILTKKVFIIKSTSGLIISQKLMPYQQLTCFGPSAHRECYKRDSNKTSRCRYTETNLINFKRENIYLLRAPSIRYTRYCKHYCRWCLVIYFYARLQTPLTHMIFYR